jgi:hypothetical protein
MSKRNSFCSICPEALARKLKIKARGQMGINKSKEDLFGSDNQLEVKKQK